MCRREEPSRGDEGGGASCENVEGVKRRRKEWKFVGLHPGAVDNVRDSLRRKVQIRIRVDPGVACVNVLSAGLEQPVALCLPQTTLLALRVEAVMNMVGSFCSIIAANEVDDMR